MPRISDISTLRLSEQPVVCIRKETVPEELPEIIGSCYAQLVEYLEETGGCLADVPFVKYFENFSCGALSKTTACSMNFTVELCFPTASKLPSAGDIIAKVLPPMNVAFCMVLGSYGAIGIVYEEMVKWLQEKGYAIPQSSREYYYNGQGYSTEHLLTKLVMPLEQEEKCRANT